MRRGRGAPAVASASAATMRMNWKKRFEAEPPAVPGARPTTRARTEDPHVDVASPSRGAHGGLGLELHPLVGIVKVLTDVAVALEHRARAPAADVRRRELGPRPQAPGGQRLEEAHRTVDVRGAEALGILGEEDRLPGAVDHPVHGGAESREVGEAQAGGRIAEVALDDLEIAGAGRQRRARRRPARRRSRRRGPGPAR